MSLGQNTRIYKLIVRAKRLFTPLALVSIFLLAWSSREQLDSILQSASTHLLARSILVWALAHSVSPAFTWALMASRGVRLGYCSALKIHVSRLPAKYLPGGIWNSVARVNDYHKLGVPSRQIGAYLLAENLLAFSGSLGLGCFIFLCIGITEPPWRFILCAGMLLSLGAALSTPFVCNVVEGSSAPVLDRLRYMQALLALIVFWLMAAWAFILFISAFSVVPEEMSSHYLGGVYLISWAAGFVAIFAPQGVGVSEFVQSTLIPVDADRRGILVVLAGFRLVILTGDMLTYLVWIGAMRYNRNTR